MFIFHYLASIIPSALEDEHTSPLSRIRRSAIWSKVCNVLMLCSDDMEAYGRFWWYGRSAIWSKVCNVLAMFWWYGSIWKVLMIWKVSHLIKSVQCSGYVLMIWKHMEGSDDMEGHPFDQKCAMFWCYVLMIWEPTKLFYGPIPTFFYLFCCFLIPVSIKISTIQIEKVWMICLGFEPGPQDGRRKAMAAAPNLTIVSMIQTTFFDLHFKGASNDRCQSFLFFLLKKR